MLPKLEDVLKTEIDPAFAKRAAFIFQEIERKKPKKILDVGCGRGFYVRALTLYDFPVEIHGIDINAEYIVRAKQNSIDKRVKLKMGDIYALPFKGEYFDLAICSEILEHLKDDTKGLAEVNRVLKRSGTLIITVPNKNFPFFWDPLNWILMRIFDTHINKDKWWLAGIWADHERLYTKDMILRKVKKQFALKNTKLFVHWCWPFSHFLLYGIGKNIVERFGAKEFDRFVFSKKKIGSLIANFFVLPARMFDSNIPTKSSVNIVILAQKK